VNCRRAEREEKLERRETGEESTLIDFWDLGEPEFQNLDGKLIRLKN
jgi:hypothetical protein